MGKCHFIFPFPIVGRGAERGIEREREKTCKAQDPGEHLWQGTAALPVWEAGAALHNPVLGMGDALIPLPRYASLHCIREFYWQLGFVQICSQSPDSSVPCFPPEKERAPPSLVTSPASSPALAAVDYSRCPLPSFQMSLGDYVLP